MFVTIWSVSDAANLRRGKKARVQSKKIDVKVQNYIFPKRFEFASVIEIKAENFQYIGSGARGGWPKEITRQLHIEFTKEDFSRILEVALKEGFMDLGVENYLAAAKLSIERAQERVGIRKP